MMIIPARANAIAISPPYVATNVRVDIAPARTVLWSDMLPEKSHNQSVQLNPAATTHPATIEKIRIDVDRIITTSAATMRGTSPFASAIEVSTRLTIAKVILFHQRSVRQHECRWKYKPRAGTYPITFPKISHFASKHLR